MVRKIKNEANKSSSGKTGNMNSNLFIITGGPGSGKTTLLAELEKRGFQCVSEVARIIIQQQIVSKGNALPWDDAESLKT